MNPVNDPLIDPACAICDAPASLMCQCEAEELERAVNRAEEIMLTKVLGEIREWVKTHARDFILKYYSNLAEHHEKVYCARIRDLKKHAAEYNNAPPHQDDLDREEFKLKHNLNEAWKASVHRYPEVLKYFYTLVDINRPDDSDIGVSDPPFYPNDEEKFYKPANVRTRESNEEHFRKRESDQDYDHIQRKEYDTEHDHRQRRRRTEKYTDQEMSEDLSRSERTRDRRDDYRSGSRSHHRKYGI